MVLYAIVAQKEPLEINFHRKMLGHNECEYEPWPEVENPTAEEELLRLKFPHGKIVREFFVESPLDWAIAVSDDFFELPLDRQYAIALAQKPENIQ